jgi:hypothetical protein
MFGENREIMGEIYLFHHASMTMPDTINIIIHTMIFSLSFYVILEFQVLKNQTHSKVTQKFYTIEFFKLQRHVH